MISTHILDTSKGAPAAGVGVRLQKLDKNQWVTLNSGKTNVDGRFVFTGEVLAGSYQIIFETEDYLKKEVKDFFFLNVPVAFKVEDINRNYHVPLLLNPFGFSTYRGS